MVFSERASVLTSRNDRSWTAQYGFYHTTEGDMESKTYDCRTRDGDPGIVAESNVKGDRGSSRVLDFSDFADFISPANVVGMFPVVTCSSGG
jgi:hypothetical protein